MDGGFTCSCPPGYSTTDGGVTCLSSLSSDSDGSQAGLGVGAGIGVGAGLAGAGSILGMWYCLQRKAQARHSCADGREEAIDLEPVQLVIVEQGVDVGSVQVEAG
eukprot:2364564-Rhodomonas_salina.1